MILKIIKNYPKKIIKTIYFDDKYSLIEYFKVLILIGIFFKKRLRIFGITKMFFDMIDIFLLITNLKKNFK